jgi:fimbrial chaperone protein
MRNSFILKCCFAFIFTLFLPLTAKANLLIYPVRVSFDDQQRSAQVTLTNTSNKTTTYRLDWIEKKGQTDGSYIDLSNEEANGFPIASPMLRYSPRQVTLKAGERQVIKLSLRRPRELAEGEYRSHLLFKAMPPSKEESEQRTTSTDIKIVLSFAIPVTVQQGKFDAQVTLNGASILYNLEKNTGKVSVAMTRQGNNSTSGDLSAFWTPTGGEEVLIAKLADFNFWPETNSINIPLIWADAKFSPTDGKLRIFYEGVRQFDDITFVNKELNINRNQIVIEK